MNEYYNSVPFLKTDFYKVSIPFWRRKNIWCTNLFNFDSSCG